MNVLFVFYVPSGGMDTINRLRCHSLRQYGIQTSCLYYFWGAGVQNQVDFPMYITNDDNEIKGILDANHFDVIIVTSDHKSFDRFRRLGYQGKLVLEIQGYGPKEVAREQLTEAIPYVNAHVSALMNPNTPHIETLYDELFPYIPKFQFPNCFDSEGCSYRVLPKQTHPIIAWLGRIEDNKNWKEFLYIGHQLSYYVPNLAMWMFEDENLSIPHEREQFVGMMKGLGIEQRISLFSNIPNVEMQYYFSSIGDSGGFMCNTSKVEGGPLSVLEAMSCRCPVLATNSDGVSEMIEHNVTGKSYVQGNVAQAVSEGLDLMINLELREQIRNTAREFVQSKFNIHAYCQNFIYMLYHI